MSSASVSAIIVAYEDPESVRVAVSSLRAQSTPPREIIIVDNHPQAMTAQAFADDEDVTVVACPSNGGFAGGAAVGAKLATSELLFWLNPDAEVSAGALQRLCAVMAEHPQAAAAGAQILLPDGSTNAGENPVHISGLSWSGRYGQAAESGPARQVLAASGAALLVRATAYAAIGGIAEHFFLYCEDTDLCWRARLCGYEVWLCPDAHVLHQYSFAKGTSKYRYLERNRVWMLLANLQVRTLILLAPLLAATEVGMWAVAFRGGWAAQKWAAYRDLAASPRRIRAWRRQVQARRVLSDRELLERFTARIDTPLVVLPFPAFINFSCAAYRRLLLALTR